MELFVILLLLFLGHLVLNRWPYFFYKSSLTLLIVPLAIGVVWGSLIRFFPSQFTGNDVLIAIILTIGLFYIVRIRGMPVSRSNPRFNKPLFYFGLVASVFSITSTIYIFLNPTYTLPSFDEITITILILAFLIGWVSVFYFLGTILYYKVLKWKLYTNRQRYLPIVLFTLGILPFAIPYMIWVSVKSLIVSGYFSSLEPATQSYIIIFWLIVTGLLIFALLIFLLHKLLLRK